MSARIGFELGWDYASFGISMPDSANSNMREGYSEGKRHFGKATKQSNFIDRKWLLIRFNAFRRNRVFDDQVTPEFLAWICSGYCPISHVSMTIASLTDSDWSVDRILNDAGYTRNNLMIVATRVNLAKGNKSLADVKAILEGSVVDSSLSMIEWKRLFGLMQDVYFHAGLINDEAFVVLPADNPGHRHIDRHYSAKLQYSLLSMSLGLDNKNRVGHIKDKKILSFMEAIRSTCDDAESKRLLHRLCTKLQRKLQGVASMAHVWLNPVTFKYFLNLLDYQKTRGVWPRLLNEYSMTCKNIPDSKNCEIFCKEFSLDTRGYNVN